MRRGAPDFYTSTLAFTLAGTALNVRGPRSIMVETYSVDVPMGETVLVFRDEGKGRLLMIGFYWEPLGTLSAGADYALDLFIVADDIVVWWVLMSDLDLLNGWQVLSKIRGVASTRGDATVVSPRGGLTWAMTDANGNVAKIGGWLKTDVDYVEYVELYAGNTSSSDYRIYVAAVLGEYV